MTAHIKILRTIIWVATAPLIQAPAENLGGGGAVLCSIPMYNYLIKIKINNNKSEITDFINSDVVCNLKNKTYERFHRKRLNSDPER